MTHVVHKTNTLTNNKTIYIKNYYYLLVLFKTEIQIILFAYLCNTKTKELDGSIYQRIASQGLY